MKERKTFLWFMCVYVCIWLIDWFRILYCISRAYIYIFIIVGCSGCVYTHVFISSGEEKVIKKECVVILLFRCFHLYPEWVSVSSSSYRGWWIIAVVTCKQRFESHFFYSQSSSFSPLLTPTSLTIYCFPQ